MPAVSLNQCPLSPWKNGAGVTQELLRLGGEPFELRLSIAQVSSDGPFSLYPEHDRVLLLLEGGLQLVRTDEKITLNTFEPFYFSGDEVITSKLMKGESKDFNIMYRKGSKLSVEVLQLDNTTFELNDGIYVFVCHGQVTYEGVNYSETLFYHSGELTISNPTKLIVIKSEKKNFSHP